MTLRVDNDRICKKCYVVSDGNDIQHSLEWICTRPEVTEEQFLAVKAAKDERLARFRATYEGKTHL